MPPRAFNAAFHIYRAKTVPDVWLAHCLTLDVVTQGAPGSGAEGALRALQEALLACVAADWAAGLDPLERAQSAPRHLPRLDPSIAQWRAFEEAFTRGEACPGWSMDDAEAYQSVVGWLLLDPALRSSVVLIVCKERKP